MTAASVATAKTTLAVVSIGYLVPRPRFGGVVQSIHARACNIRCGDALLTLLAPGACEGPTTLLLDCDCALDLRTCFRVGDAVARRGTRLLSCGADADLSHAVDWKPAAMPPFAEASKIAANLCTARTMLAARLEQHASVLHREARTTCARLEQACRACDSDMALPAAERLIGWGEGLTPAGDDYLVGLMAGLYSLSAELPLRRIFLRCLAAAVLASVASTTPVSAHFLRLAAHGHFTADVHRVRDALLSANEVAPLRRFVDDMLAVGATSGADVLTGLLSGICAWFQPPPTPNRT